MVKKLLEKEVKVKEVTVNINVDDDNKYFDEEFELGLENWKTLILFK